MVELLESDAIAELCWLKRLIGFRGIELTHEHLRS
jgi:hypothetical protein